MFARGCAAVKASPPAASTAAAAAARKAAATAAPVARRSGRTWRPTPACQQRHRRACRPCGSNRGNSRASHDTTAGCRPSPAAAPRRASPRSGWSRRFRHRAPARKGRYFSNSCRVISGGCSTSRRSCSATDRYIRKPSMASMIRRPAAVGACMMRKNTRLTPTSSAISTRMTGDSSSIASTGDADSGADPDRQRAEPDDSRLKTRKYAPTARHEALADSGCRPRFRQSMRPSRTRP